MKTIYKYNLPIEDEFNVLIPIDSKVVHVGAQGDYAFMWIEHSMDVPGIIRRFYVRGTGRPFTGRESRHIGTFFMNTDVWHVYE